MRKIILASKSKARRKLLKQIGLKFTVTESNAKEQKSHKKGCSRLVIDNALNKAKEVAKRLSAGIIIAADTIVLSGNKIIAKPKNMKDAFKTLKLLSKKPQWVYTGLAVLDIDQNKLITDYEKTKIYMYKLNDKEIKSYFKKVSPLDKAGSFDIQGIGGMFIDRVEGCFYNVVGMPLAKLAKILKKLDVDIFS